jgi:hypothetical protein
MLRGQDGLTIPEVNKLPNTLGILKSHVLQQLPLLNMRTKAIPLLEAKLPTLPASQKNKSGDSTTKDLHFFDPEHLFKSIMSCDIGKKIHQGFGMFVDSETEAWHSYAWKSSVRSTSGHYTYYPDGNPIFPSDFIMYNSSEDPDEFSLGRVCTVGHYFMSDAPVSGQLTLMVQQCYTWAPDLEELLGVLDPPITEYEPLLCWDQIFYLPESAVLNWVDIDLDYKSGIWGHVIPLDTDENGLEVPKEIPTPEGYYIRRILEDPYKKKAVSWLCHSHPIRGELELKLWDREYFENWDISKTSTKCISVPIQMFIDGFGVY